MKSKHRFCLCVGLILLVQLSFSPKSLFSQTAFFQGKTITIIQGRDPGGAGDLVVKALIPYLEKHIPGTPIVVNEYMPGGGSRKAANHIFRNARPDGLTIGNLSGGMVSLAILGESGILYDLDRFSYLGSPYSTYHSVFLSRKSLGLSSIERLRSASAIKIGTQSVGSTVYNEARLFAYILGLKDPKFVAAYSGAELDLALLQGEVDARTSGADTLVQRNKDWLDGSVVDFHTILETPKGEKHPTFNHIPELESFARSEKERKLIAMQRAFRVTGGPFVLPPGTPKDRVVILQEAFRKAYKDPEFFKYYKKLTGDDPSPLLPEDHERAIREIPRDHDVIELFKKLVGPGPMPSR